MHISTLASTISGTMALVGAAVADEHLRIVEEPLELTIHMHWDRSQGYFENYAVEQAARELTGIHLKDATAGTNTTDTGEAMNL